MPASEAACDNGAARHIAAYVKMTRRATIHDAQKASQGSAYLSL